METNGSSFSSFGAYGRALTEIPKRFSLRAGSVSTTFEEMSRVRARSGSNMQKTLRWFDLVGFGIGGMVGAGVFVTTGRTSLLHAGPAIVLSYAVAGFYALLSAFCYTEFAVDMPVAGGAFSYLRVTFGEFAAFLTGANLVMEYVLSNAAIARSFTTYLGTSIRVSATEKWRITISGLPKGFNEIDFIAIAVVLIITLCMCYSTKESSVLNMVLTTIHLLFIAFIIFIGFWKGDWKNFTELSDPKKPNGFFPYGASGVFSGAAMVYLSYIRYDVVSTMAEEVRNPTKDIPIGVSGSVVLVTILYCLMAASMSKLVPYDAIDEEAPFFAAFRGLSNGWGWVSNLIGVGASFGILTSLLVSMLGQARYLCVIGRSNVVPAWFARVHPKRSTPVNASVFLGIFTAAISLFTDLEVLLNLVSIGTLFVFFMVANAVIYRRHVSFGPAGKPKAIMLSACTVMGVAVLQIFHFAVPQVRKPEFWGVPLMLLVIFPSIYLVVSNSRDLWSFLVPYPAKRKVPKGECSEQATAANIGDADPESNEIRCFELLRHELIELEKRVQRSSQQSENEEDINGAEGIASYASKTAGGLVQVQKKESMIGKSIDKLKETSTNIWQGTQLLAIDVTTAVGLLRRVLTGDEITEKEKKALRRTLTELASIVPIGILMLLPVTAVGHAAMLAAIQRYVPALIPSTYGPERLDLLRKLEKVKEMECNEMKPDENAEEGSLRNSPDNL